MDTLQKFYTDIDRIKKHERASKAGGYDGLSVSRQVKDLFERNNRNYGGLGASFSDYWLDTYILNSGNLKEEPTEEHINKLAAMEALLEGSEDNEDTASLDGKDWKELCSLVNLEAEDLPLDLLNSLMMKFVEKQAL